MKCCSTLTNVIVGVSAVIYLILGVVIAGVSASTFFTPYGEIITGVYAASGIGGGVAIFLISVVGFCVACSKRGTCLLSLFTLLTLIITLMIIIALVLMFDYESVLRSASSMGASGGVKVLNR